MAEPSPSNAELRSAAVAKLKRAASLPRNANGRRPSASADTAGEGSSSVHASPSFQQAGRLQDHAETPAKLPLAIQPHYGEQEVLSPSPVAATFDQSIHAHAHAPGQAQVRYRPIGLQRSASNSSDYHMPTPLTAMGYGPSSSHSTFFSPSPSSAGTATGTPDWAAIQLAQSFLPSLNAAGSHPPSPFGLTPGLQGPGAGRNTPSPLPSLGDLASLQRSNSAAARAKAMSKLTGGRDTPTTSDDDRAGASLHPNRSLLQRAGTVAGGHSNRLYPLASSTRVSPTPPDPALVASATAPVAGQPRPRLQRSFTVSSTNMGEERRSAVGRRMVQRLASRQVAREEEEKEVRRIWEEKRAQAESRNAAESASVQQDDAEAMKDHGFGDHGYDHYEDEQEPEMLAPAVLTHEQIPNSVTFGHTETLAVPERPESRDTMLSSGEAFEYESHLRRSLSSRTARGAVGVVQPSAREVDTVPNVEIHHYGVGAQEHPGPQSVSHASSMVYDGDDDPLTPPRAAFAVGPRHIQQASTSSDATIQGTAASSPSSDSTLSRDALPSMMFVVGRDSHGGPSGERQGPAFPTGVEEGGASDWGTPAKGHPSRLTASSGTSQGESSRLHDSSAVETGEESDDPYHQPHDSTRSSGMSWTNVGGADDLEVPSDMQYHKKSGSISAKIGRTVKTAMRKQSQSRSSSSSISKNVPLSPNLLSDTLAVAASTFGRRTSGSSLSPSQSSMRGPGHQPSISSLSPSLTRSESVSNTSLLQHEAPQRDWLPPRATEDDPRIMSSKMSPFPGIARLEQQNRASADTISSLAVPEAPRMVQLASDSAIPSAQRVTPAEPIYALPLPTAPGSGPRSEATSRRTSTDSITKRSWLSKAFGQATSPRSSGSAAPRKLSVSDPRQEQEEPHDPFAAPPAPSPAIRRPSATRPRPASPSVSVVPEVSEEGSRLTRFMAMRQDTNTPVLQAVEEKNNTLPPRSVNVLKRMDSLLALGPDDPARPDILDDPPRKLLLATQILQVVNIHTAKDRFLFLFNDILVITKPLITHGTQATLDMRFVVKSIVSLDKLHISGFEPEPSAEPERHAVVNRFIEQFAADPVLACRYLVERSNPKVDAVTLASLIFKTPELDKSQIGILLAGNERLMKAFIDRFHFTGVKLDEALRTFLLSLRLPTERTACENLLYGFAHRYHEANQHTVTYDKALAADLIMSTMELNDAVYGTFGFALPNHAITQDIFISAFRSKDPNNTVPEDLLSGIYNSIRGHKLVQALASREASQARKITVSPARLPPKLTFDVWSERISISVPRPDMGFKIMLYGEGLEFDPPELDFSHSTEQGFRVKGTSLGTKSVLLLRTGDNAALYGELGNTRTFTIERAFMRNTFHVSFLSHTNVKRKYCFSVTDPDLRLKWGRLLERQIRSTREVSAKTRHRIRSTAEAVSMQVLRDALLPPDEKLPPLVVDKAPSAGPGKATRAGSVSIAYDEDAGASEKATLGPLQPPKASAGAVEKQSGLVDVQTGKELVLLCRQNSLLPGLLELLQAGRSGEPDEGEEGSS